MLLIPAFIALFGIKETAESKENKQLAGLPQFTVKRLDPFPVKFENWFNDHFTFRNTLISQHGKLFVKAFHISSKPKLVGIGKEGWLYLMNSEIDNYTGDLKVSEALQKRCLEELNWRYDTCKSMGAEFMLVVIPSKPTVYPEYLPAYVHKSKSENGTDKFLNHFKGKAKFKLLDLRQTIIDAKVKGQLFYRSDNHWNDLSSYTAYTEIMKFMNQNGYNLTTFPISQCRQTDSIFNSGNVAGMIDMYKEFEEPAHFIYPQTNSILVPRNKENYKVEEGFPYPWTYEEARQNVNPDLPGLLIFRESFTTSKLMDLMGTSFGRSTFIFDSWQHKLNLEILKKEKPKVVICMVLESFLNTIPYNACKPSLISTNPKKN